MLWVICDYFPPHPSTLLSTELHTQCLQGEDIYCMNSTNSITVTLQHTVYTKY